MAFGRKSKKALKGYAKYKSFAGASKASALVAAGWGLYKFIKSRRPVSATSVPTSSA